MNFTLTYDGDLFATKKGSRLVEHKQEIRRKIHRQLLELFKGSGIDLSKPSFKNIFTTIGKFQFYSLVSAARKECAELQIILLRPGKPPGYIIGEGGDIDNRLNTLFDSLRIPQKKEIPSGDKPKKNEKHFLCLLEDDILITKLSVTTDRLLKPVKSESYVKLIIHVQTKDMPRMIIR